MKPAFEDMNLQIPAVTAEPEDYTGEDGLLYCGKCRTPKEAYFPADKATLFGRDRHPAECDCQRAQRMEREAAEQQRKHRDKVEELKRRGFTDPAMREWTFANDNGRNPQMKTAHFYVEHWEDMKAGNIGYLLWGSVGTGKSYLAGCIANALMLDRKRARCPNGLKLGTPGSGKSMSCKSEILSVFLCTPDDVYICDPEAEYYPLVKRLHGQVVKLSPTSKNYVNPLDINLNYSEDENPLALKSDFVLSFCELVMGGKNGLEAIEKTVIDRAVQVIYRPYLADPKPENMPILADLHKALLDQHIPEADRVAQALDLYVSGSLNVFNHRTNIDIQNRIVAFDIKELGKQLKKIGMLIVQDQIWGRVTQNRSKGKATWYFCDEFHLLLREEQTAAFSCEIWKRFRKWGGIPTGATQNVKDLLSSPEIENILENSDFICLLNQASGDRKILAERLNISPQQLRYVDNSEPGEGLLIYENVILPFKNPIPKNTQLYQIMTTRLGEGATV